MAPERRARVRVSLRSPSPANLAQHALHKGSRGRHEGGWFPDLGHGGGDEVGLDKLDFDVVGGEFAAEGNGPLLQESFAAAVGGQKRRGDEATEGAHGQNQAAFPLGHARCY